MFKYVHNLVIIEIAGALILKHPPKVTSFGGNIMAIIL